MKISLGFSSCPNDTFMFEALVHGKVDTEGLEFEVFMADILHLNQKALAGELQVVKTSYNAFGHVWKDYALLRSGSAMGKGCGPLIISKEPMSLEQLLEHKARIAIPGKNTTANLLLNFYAPALVNRSEMLFHEVMPAVESGACTAGLIIHENRFTYQDFGLRLVQDLGEHWESQTGLPIPLGAICASRDLGDETIAKVERVLQRSIAWAFAHPESSSDYVKCHAQEMDPEVTQAHIQLYVNDFSLNMGAEGVRAVMRLLAEGEKMGLFVAPSTSEDLFAGN